MELLAIGAAMMIGFGLAVTLQWAVLAAVVYGISDSSRGGARRGPTSAPPAGAS